MQSARNPLPQVGWRLALQWTIANIVGWGVGLAFGFAIVGRLSQIVGGFLSQSNVNLSLALVGAMVGMMTIPVGIMQWFVLRRQMERAGRWVLASTVGWIIGLAIGWSASMVLNDSSDAWHSAAMGAITGGIGGGVSGAMQWIVTWQEDMPGAWWLPASVIAWGAAFAAAWSAAWLVSRFLPVIATYTLIGVIVGSVGGAITGIVLVWLLRRPAHEGQIAAPA